jgi:hypothetical protein
MSLSDVHGLLPACKLLAEPSVSPVSLRDRRRQYVAMNFSNPTLFRPPLFHGNSLEGPIAKARDIHRPTRDNLTHIRKHKSISTQNRPIKDAKVTLKVLSSVTNSFCDRINHLMQIILLAFCATVCLFPKYQLHFYNYHRNTMSASKTHLLAFRAAALSLSLFAKSLFLGAASRASFLFADLFCSTYDICWPPLNAVRDPVVR